MLNFKKYVKLYIMKSVFLLVINIFLFVAFSTSCSLKYDTDEEFSESAPEFVFSGLEMNRLEDGKLTATLQAAKLEQYRDEDAMFAQNVLFTLYDDQGKISVTGSCGLMAADNTQEVYSLYSDVDVVSHEQDLGVQAQNIRWNGKTEQLVCGSGDSVVISTGVAEVGEEYSKPKNQSTTRLQIQGSDFSASGVSLSYKYNSPVSGTIITDVVDTSEEVIVEDLEAEAMTDLELLTSGQSIKNEVVNKQ